MNILDSDMGSDSDAVIQGKRFFSSYTDRECLSVRLAFEAHLLDFILRLQITDGTDEVGETSICDTVEVDTVVVDIVLNSGTISLTADRTLT